jgi:hypothetical protein
MDAMPSSSTVMDWRAVISVGPVASVVVQVRPPSRVYSGDAGVSGQGPVVARQATVSLRPVMRRVAGSDVVIEETVDSVGSGVGDGDGVWVRVAEDVDAGAATRGGVLRKETAQTTKRMSTTTKAKTPA